MTDSAQHESGLRDPDADYKALGKYRSKPWGFKWRSNTLFILSTVGAGLFTDMFLYGLAIPILPFLLEDRMHVRHDRVQIHVSWLIAAYAAASVVFSPVAGIVADKTSSRQLPFLVGLSALMASTILLFVGDQVWMLVLARLLQGVSGAVVWTVGLALCVDTVGPKNLGKALGTISSFISVGGFASPVLGGVLYKKSGLKSVAILSLALLGVDFLLRVLVIEKKVAARYEKGVAAAAAALIANTTPHEAHSATNTAVTTTADPTANTPLLIKNGHTSKLNSMYIIPNDVKTNFLTRRLPIFHTFRSPSLALAIAVPFASAIVMGALDATVPMQGRDLFDFDSLQVGILFAPLVAMDLIFGPIGGWAVDRFGTKIVAVGGYAFLVPVHILLRLPRGDAPHDSPAELRQILLYGGLLALCGVGTSLCGSPTLVEASAEIGRFERANPGLFGEGGLYAQMCGLNSMVFCLGLSVGPVIAGWLKEQIGYGNMAAVMAAICAATSVACFWWLGGPPVNRWWTKVEGIDGDEERSEDSDRV